MKDILVLSADSTCDLGPELKERYRVNYFPLHIILEDKDYPDGVDIQPEAIYRAFYEKKALPKTAAINVAEYKSYFGKLTADGSEVIHINLGSALSSSFQNCALAAKETGNVHVVDSHNLSTGMGLLALEAGRMIEEGMDTEEIADKLRQETSRCHASFILDSHVTRAGCTISSHCGPNTLGVLFMTA